MPTFKDALINRLTNGNGVCCTLKEFIQMFAEDEAFELRVDIYSSDDDLSYTGQKLQIGHLTNGQLYSVPGFMDTKWVYVRGIDNRYPVPPVLFYAPDSGENDIYRFVKFEPLITPEGAKSTEQLWVTLKEFPVKQPHSLKEELVTPEEMVEYELTREVKLFIVGSEDDIGLSHMTETIDVYVKDNYTNTFVNPIYIQFAPGVATFGDCKINKAEDKSDIWHIPTMPNASGFQLCYTVNYLNAVRHALDSSATVVNGKTILVYIDDKPWDEVIYQKFTDSFCSFCIGRITTNENLVKLTQHLITVINHDLRNGSLGA